MRSLLDGLGVAFRALASRPGRALLMMVGPLLGVAVIVGAIGVLQSTTGELREALRRLGTNLILVEAAEGRLPLEAASRVATISTVEGVTGLGTVTGPVVNAAPPAGRLSTPVANVILLADPNLLQVMEIDLVWGRTLAEFDEEAGTTAAVLGSNVALRLGLDGPDIRTIYLGAYPFAVVGVLEPSLLHPPLNSAVLIPSSTAQHMFGSDTRPFRMLVKVQEGTEHRTARLLAPTVTYGARGSPLVSIPSDLLAAQAEIDRTLAGAVIGLGLLAMAVGGFGIANVMLISVMERRREIGVRRALGHRRTAIALQYLAESAIVGLLGAAAGSALAASFVTVVSISRGWVVVLDPVVVAGALAAAMLVSVLAGLYPARRAARLQPLDALRGE